MAEWLKRNTVNVEYGGSNPSRHAKGSKVNLKIYTFCFYTVLYIINTDVIYIMDKIVMKVCKKHGLTEYVYTSENRYRCKKCMSDCVNEKRRRLKRELVEYKGGKCEICGYNDCIAALGFHHLNTNEKDFAIGNGNIKSLERLKKEADKCILVCNRCPEEIHYKIWQEKEEKYQEEIQRNIENFEENCKIYNNTNHDNYYNRIILDANEIKNDLENKLTQKEIAKKYNVSLSKIKNFLNENDF